jgi:hypothetical protein
LQAEKRKNNVNKTIKFNNNSELRANLLNRIKELSTHKKKKAKINKLAGFLGFGRLKFFEAVLCVCLYD